MAFGRGIAGPGLKQKSGTENREIAEELKIEPVCPIYVHSSCL